MSRRGLGGRSVLNILNEPALPPQRPAPIPETPDSAPAAASHSGGTTFGNGRTSALVTATRPSSSRPFICAICRGPGSRPDMPTLPLPPCRSPNHLDNVAAQASSSSSSGATRRNTTASLDSGKSSATAGRFRKLHKFLTVASQDKEKPEPPVYSARTPVVSHYEDAPPAYDSLFDSAPVTCHVHPTCRDTRRTTCRQGGQDWRPSLDVEVQPFDQGELAAMLDIEIAHLRVGASHSRS